MCVDVTGRHARHLEPAREQLQSAVASAIVAQKRSLQLDPEPLGAERIAQPPQRGLVVDAVQRAAREANQSLAVLEDRLERSEWLGGRRAGSARARVRVRASENAAEIGPPPGVLHQ